MLFEKLSDFDKSLIKNYLSTYGPNSGSEVYRGPTDLNTLLRYWDSAKSEYLWNLMRGEFILSKEVLYAEPISRIEEQIAHALSDSDGEMFDFYREIQDYINHRYDGNIWNPNANLLRSLFRASALATNSAANSLRYGTIEFDNGKKVKIDCNTKPMRALGKIAKILGLETSFEKFRLKHSLILNQKKLTGTLCLSIHPLDYLTMSENANGWSSCMNWTEPGCYRLGTVEMMNSPMVIVAYLKSHDKQYIWGPDRTWNSKLWRMLIVVSPNGIVSIKGYPYYHADLIKTVINWIRDLAMNNLGWNYFGEPIELPDYEEVCQYYDKNFYLVDCCTEAMYNDFGASRHWAAFPMRIESMSSAENPILVNFAYSGVTQCMCCGNALDIDCFYDESHVYCENCCSMADESAEVCGCCGETWDRDEMYWVDTEYLCPHCFDRYAGECDIDHCCYHNSDLIRVYLARQPDQPGENDYTIIIHKSYNDDWELPFSTRHRITIKHPRHDSDNDIYYFNQEDLTEEGINYYFGISKDEGLLYFAPPKDEEN